MSQLPKENKDSQNLIEMIWNFILSIIEFFSGPKSSGSTKYKPNSRDFRNSSALKVAAREIGQKEVVGSGNNRQVVKYHAYARKDNNVSKGLADSVPWCASFVCFVLENSGMASTNSMQARSFLNWGRSTRSKPLPGDLVVFWRGSKDSWQGHVGFFLEETSSYIYVLGGNQNDSVNVSRYSKSKLLDIRRSTKHIKLNEPQEDMLWDMAEDLIKGRKIQTDGKVS